MEICTADPPIPAPAIMATPATTMEGQRPHRAVTDEAKNVETRPAT